MPGCRSPTPRSSLRPWWHGHHVQFVFRDDIRIVRQNVLPEDLRRHPATPISLEEIIIAEIVFSATKAAAATAIMLWSWPPSATWPCRWGFSACPWPSRRPGLRHHRHVLHRHHADHRHVQPAHLPVHHAHVPVQRHLLPHLRLPAGRKGCPWPSPSTIWSSSAALLPRAHGGKRPRQPRLPPALHRGLRRARLKTMRRRLVK